MGFPSISFTTDDPAVDNSILQRNQQLTNQFLDTKMQTILDELNPITCPTYDSEGNIIQIWQRHHIYLAHLCHLFDCFLSKTP